MRVWGFGGNKKYRKDTRSHTAMILTFNHQDVQGILAKIGDESRNSKPRSRRAVLPQESYDRPWRFVASRSEIETNKLLDGILPIVVGCVTYEILPDRSVHQTRFIYHVVKLGAPLGIVIPLQDGTLDKDSLMCGVHGGSDAD
jgi:hypothetical protein